MRPHYTQIARLLPIVTLVAAAWPAAAGIKPDNPAPHANASKSNSTTPAVTLVEEERLVPLTAGVNEVVFAWANTAIDKDSIQFRCLTDPERTKVLSVSYPPNENALTWQVAAPQAGPARVRISYVIGQLNKSFTYRAVAANDERTLTLRQYINLHNQSNEEFGVAGMWAGFGERFERPIGINETKQLLSAKFVDIPIDKVYTADLQQFGYLDRGKQQLRIPMHYVLHNDKPHGLGEFALMPGKVRIFQDDGHGTTAFIGEDWGRFTPRDDEMRPLPRRGQGYRRHPAPSSVANTAASSATSTTTTSSSNTRSRTSRTAPSCSTSPSRSSTCATRFAATPAATSSGNWSPTVRSPSCWTATSPPPTASSSAPRSPRAAPIRKPSKPSTSSTS